MSDRRRPRPVVSDDLALILQAAFYHPNLVERAALHQWITDWTASLKPRFSEEEIRGALVNEQGTEVEPFALDPQDLEIATLAIRIAFSAGLQCTRFRVVGSETIGIAGGLVLTDQLKGYYVQRVAWAKHRTTPWNTSFVAPAVLQQVSTTLARHIALGTVGSAGWELRIPGTCWGEITSTDALQLTLSAVDSESTGEQARRALKVGWSDGTVRIRASDAESLMRLTALAEDRAMLALSGKRLSAVTRVIVCLAPLEEEQTFPVFLTQTSLSPRQWAGFWSTRSVPLPSHFRESIAHAFPLHDTWATPALIAKLL